MRNYVRFGVLRKEAEETAHFIEGVNDLFDTLNSAAKHGIILFNIFLFW